MDLQTRSRVSVYHFAGVFVGMMMLYLVRLADTHPSRGLEIRDHVRHALWVTTFAGFLQAPLRRQSPQT